ncbi:MAG: CpaF family protein [Acetatifactor sp.]|nr:CpaF family protein [Lachnospiraceae bacterium]MBQ3905159.1 CpaF family protein [Lachnospiraceae bacterium]MCR4598546.1 CpaF family protein [Acetatifactor sp.]
MVDIQKIKQEMRDHVREKMDYGRDYCDEEIEELIDEELLEHPASCRLTVDQRLRMKKELFDSMRRLDILQFFVEDPSVSEIMINGCDNIFVERGGRLSKLELTFDSKERLRDLIQQIVAGCNRVVNEAQPIVDARLSDGARVNVVMDPVAINGPIVTIRRFPQNPITMQQLLAFGSISKEAAQFLEQLVKAHYSIFVSGSTGSGKTTFLNALSAFVQKDERIITIEDSAELQLLGIDNLVRLETRNGNVSGCQEISIRDLIRTSLRMRPDRIIVGEVRGGEAADMLTALNTGHDGSMSTGHANSARDMLSRLENMVLMGMDLPLMAIRQQIASGIDVIVHLGRLRDKSRKVLEIAEVLGFEDGEIKLGTLFSFEESGEEDGKVLGRLVRKGELTHEDKLKAAGLSPI